MVKHSFILIFYVYLLDITNGIPARTEGASHFPFPTISSFLSLEAPIVSPLFLLPSVLPTHQQTYLYLPLLRMRYINVTQFYDYSDFIQNFRFVLLVFHDGGGGLHIYFLLAIFDRKIAIKIDVCF
ncbi:UNVERIFIED_CONTAM: hypothetical protein K2H54_074416 [Gekko kuhli]